MTYLQKKKLAFMSIVNNVKGFVRTVTGIPPLTLPDCVDADSIINYTIDGNSVQDGTPTPENPVEVESVGERTKNLIGVKPVSRTINGATFTVNENGSITLNGTTTSQVVYHFNPSYNEPIRRVSVTANKSYTLSRGVELPTGVYFMIYYIDSSGAYTYINSPNTFTPTEDVNIAFYIRWDAGITMDNVTIYPQLEEGSTATEYEPYGYKIPVKASGKNLINPVFTGNLFVDSKVGSVIYKADGTHSQIVKVKPNTTYTISGVCTGMNSNAMRIGFTKDYPAVGVAIISARTIFVAQTYQTAKITTPVNCNYLLLSTGGTSVYDYTENQLQIEEGEGTPYEPYIEPITTNIYLNEPLRKINDYADYIDFENECVIRNTQKITFTSDKAYLYTTYGNGIRFDNVLQEGENRYNGYCTHSKDVQMTSVAGGMWCGANNTASVYWIGILDVLGLTTVDEFKTWLDAQEIPVEVVCEKNMAVIEPITLPKLPTFKGTTIYSIETAVQPSNMSATYYSTSKGD